MVILVASVGVSSILVPSAFSDSHIAKAEFYFQEGLADLKFGEYKKAIRHFDQALNLDPNYLDAYINKGIAFHEMENFEEAISNYDKVLEIDPDNSVALNNKGYVFSKMKKYDEAVPFYNRALETDPTYLDAIYNLADAYRKLWYCEESIIYYDKIIEERASIFEGCPLGIALNAAFFLIRRKQKLEQLILTSAHDLATLRAERRSSDANTVGTES